ncbi:MAG TPA: A/G-specific adenine glycosylase [Candidatus Avoscillospira stercorigallinarum]|uniref:Adenine DNA glycosylase n=1 Tax=Candidatus Avoscillospira stercorigallinarum TaxID=2840708 RepID=A0A9D0Z5C1_9FIRM|nr:A/G-specific adenine glycosylase [Candidatus Avoscillospira stercorigallinarum]
MTFDFSALPGRLLPWYEQNRRDLPWRRDREPYHVWLSEIMLQQTRVEAVKGYYARFLAALPTVEALAEADPELCHKLWEGLGYYSRVRNLQKAAQVIVQDLSGVFPRDYAGIRALPGVGDYTAGAIGSISFELPTPAVDGNVLRVAARLALDDRPVDRPAVKRELTAALAEIYPRGRCGDFTQALMELGATVCLPGGAPRCEACPLSDLCEAHGAGAELTVPVRTAKKPRRQEAMTVFVLEAPQGLALRKRPNTGLLAGLWELPHVPGLLEPAEALDQAAAWGIRVTELQRQAEKRHIFTHVEWEMRGYYLLCEAGGDFTWADQAQRSGGCALPTAFRQFLEESTTHRD